MVPLIGSWEAGSPLDKALFSPDATRVAITSKTAFWVCDAYTGPNLMSPPGDSRSILKLAFSPDGRRLVSGSGDGTISVWNIETGKLVFGPLMGHTRAITSVIFSCDSRFIVSGSDDHTVRIWSAQTGETAKGPVRLLMGVHWLAPLPSGRFAVGGDFGNIFPIIGRKMEFPFTVYDIDSCAIHFECSGHELAVLSLSSSPDGLLLASGSLDRTVRLWGASSGQPIGQPLEGHTAAVSLVRFSPDSKYVASSTDFDELWVWSLNNKAMHCETLPIVYKEQVVDVAFSSDGKCLMSAHRNGAVKIWDVSGLNIQAEAHNVQVNLTSPALESETASATQAFSQSDPEGIADALKELEITVVPEAEITSAATPQEIVLLLSLRGCADMTNELDLATCSEHAISSGGFGDIYQGRLKNGTHVAIKTIRKYTDSSEQNQEIFKVSRRASRSLAPVLNQKQHAAHEVYAWSKCKHPNVQPLLGLVMFRGLIGMIAQWESNGTLPQYLERHADADRCIISAQVAEGLSYLLFDGNNSASFQVHGDLKGANVLISQDGIPQLADFGNARLQEYSLKFTKTSTKEALSSRWAAPELFEGESCSYATDVYALGMFYLDDLRLVLAQQEAITGDIPWTGKSERAVMFAITIKRTCPERPETYIPSTSEQGDSLWSLLKLCWEFEPEERPSAAKVAQVVAN
ncbi:hypothetical protein FRC09_014215 [Ceratobasidium sp. 395]|nr:hypothetical protein FRC09_014215 [Ceratobasidium sp. 395]